MGLLSEVYVIVSRMYKSMSNREVKIQVVYESEMIFNTNYYNEGLIKIIYEDGNKICVVCIWVYSIVQTQIPPSFGIQGCQDSRMQFAEGLILDGVPYHISKWK